MSLQHLGSYGRRDYSAEREGLLRKVSEAAGDEARFNPKGLGHVYFPYWDVALHLDMGQEGTTVQMVDAAAVQVLLGWMLDQGVTKFEFLIDHVNADSYGDWCFVGSRNGEDGGEEILTWGFGPFRAYAVADAFVNLCVGSHESPSSPTDSKGGEGL